MSSYLRILRIGVVALMVALASPVALRQDMARANPREPAQGDGNITDVATIFQQGQHSLAKGDLKQAEQAFRTVTNIDPQSAAAYANLGVVYMREKRWDSALIALHKAERLAPRVAGIRLNIGLTYYRQSKFNDAIPAFLSVVNDEPSSVQARHLLGLCYFFTQQYAQAVTTLQPLEPVESGDLNFLYVLSISAWESKQPQIEQRAMARLVEVGGNTPEFHLLMGKAHLNREEYDDAIKELNAAALASPKLPFVHFELGEAYIKKQELDKANAEFMQDATIEPDVAFNYDQLGVIAFQQQHLKEAVEYFRHALRLDPTLASSQYQLARVYLQEGDSAKALGEVDALLRLVPDNSSAHYLRGQILQKLQRTEEAKAEMRRATEIANQARNKRQQELEGGIKDPDLKQQTPQ